MTTPTLREAAQRAAEEIAKAAKYNGQAWEMPSQGDMAEAIERHFAEVVNERDAFRAALLKIAEVRHGSLHAACTAAGNAIEGTRP